MIGRRQLPVHSPLTVGAVLASLGRDDPRNALASDLERELGAAEVVLTESGTHALTLALLAAAVRRPGAPCAMPAYACYDLVSAAVGAGVRVRLYDLDPRTLGPDPRSLARAVDGAAALVVVHLYGIPVPMDQMRAAAAASGALLIEDAAQGTGARWHGRAVGAFGDFGVLSFGRGKGETGGGGGALVVHDHALLPEPLRLLLPSAPSLPVFVAKLAAQWALGRDWLYAVPAAIPMLRLGETIYREPTTPRGMAAAHARVLSRTRQLATAEAERRRANAARLLHASPSRERTVEPADPSGAGWLRFPIVPATPISLDTAAARLGIARGYPLPLAEVPAIVPLLSEPVVAPGAAQLARTLVTLPTHSRIGARALERLEAWLSANAR